jgi:hypothetical protein
MRIPVTGYANLMSGISSQRTTSDRRPLFAWRGRKTVASMLLLALLIAGLVSGSGVVIGLGVIAIGVLGLAWAVPMRSDRLHDRLRHSRGYGAPVGWLLSVLPGMGAKFAWFVMCGAITALGVAELVSAL